MKTSNLTQILQEFKQAVTEKYALTDIRLFGSNARGDATVDSDIDIFIQTHDLTNDREKDIYNMAYELELEYDCLIDVILLSDTVIETHAAHLPIYHNILREGVLV
ncbi:MAG: nucleotidyltransferase domain-containing protein [Candidatus Electrothrix sp. AR3]|nr:nucleotidyltransferase domain-containing protein [Candidatus Electrothrix sp. AR3]